MLLKTMLRGFWLVLSLAVVSQAETSPNVILILADDLGWSDTTLYGTTTLYQTPNLERLAARGMTFNRAYSSSPLCSPTRASILTGQSPARTGITSPNCHLPKVTLTATVAPAGSPASKATIPDSVSRLKTDYYSLAEMFHDHGYVTGHFGKWHLGAEPYSPLEHGFDVDLPHHSGPGPAGSYVAPWKFKDFDHDPDVPDQHIEDRMAIEAVAFMEQHRDQPFFLNYWMFSVHAPFDAKRALIEKYRALVEQGAAQRSPTYAAMVESMDDAVGTLLETIDRLGLADNTIIVFASDNGGNMYNLVDGTTPTSNAPLRGGKATMYEGGVRGPAVMVVPGVTRPGARSDAVIQSCDFYPTLLELLSIAPQPEQVFDGVSIVPALRGQPLDRKAIFTYFPHAPGVPDWLPPSVSVHSGDWKLIRVFHGGENGAHRHKLFNLQRDPGETEDVALSEPELVRELDQLIEAFLSETQAVVPLANQNFDPTKYRPELEGVGKLKGGVDDSRSSSGRPLKASSTVRKLVAGWQPGGTCSLKLDGNQIVIASTGGDPHLSYRLPKQLKSDGIYLEFTLLSDSAGKGQVFWEDTGAAKSFHRDHSQVLEVQHDGTSQNYKVPLAVVGNLTAVRIDPSNAAGTMQLSNVRLVSEDGQVLIELR